MRKTHTSMDRNNNPLLLLGIFATILSFFASVIAMVLGVLVYTDIDKVAGALEIVASLLLLIAFAFGILAIVKNKAFSFWGTLLSIVSTIFIVCGAISDLFDYYFLLVLALALPASILSLTSFILFAIYFSKAPLKTVCFREKHTKDVDIGVKLHKIEQFKALYDEGILTSEEFEIQKNKLFAQKEDKRQMAQKYERAPLSKKKTLLLLLLPLCILLLSVCATFPAAYYAGNADLYNQLTFEMSHLDKNSAYRIERILDTISYGYRDVSAIRSEWNNDIRSCVNKINYSGRASRESYVTIGKLQGKVDDRWNFNHILKFSENMLHFARWETQDSDEYIKFEKSLNSRGQSFSTSLPNNVTGFHSGTRYYYTYEENGAIIIGYEFSNSSAKYPSFGISNFRYDERINTYLIDVFCYNENTSYIMKLTESYN